MLRSFLIISFRNLSRQKGFSIINLAGLTLGLTVGFVILLYVFSETSFDNFHKDSERIYRVAITGNLGDMPLNVAVTPGAMGPSLKRDMPEIEEYTTFEHISGDQLFGYGEKKFYENHLIYADPFFLDIFSINFIYGNKRTALNNPYSLILNRSTSEKIFGNTNPVGLELKLNNDQTYLITGVIENLPKETHLPVKIVCSFETRVREQGQRIFEDWGSMMYYTYLKLKHDVDKQEFEKKISLYINDRVNEDIQGTNINIYPYLQQISDIHLKSNLLGELKPNSDISYIYILTAIAIGILFIAGINFMNLSTARSANRAKEVGIRKINGSSRSQLIYQFIGESVFLSILGYILAIAIIELLIPILNNFTINTIDFDVKKDYITLFYFFIIALVFGLFSGSYPAFYLSSFQPLEVMQSNLKSGGSNKSLRNVLVFIQFAISSGLIAATIIIYLQLNYVNKKELGFNKSNMIVMNLRNEELKKNAQFVKSNMQNVPGVESVSLGNLVPGMSLSGRSYFPEGDYTNPWLIYNFAIDQDFIEKTFQMKILKGRNFSESFVTDSNAVLINETLQKTIKWKDPIGKKFFYGERKNDSLSVHVIGVVKDFHFRSLHDEIEPTIIHFQKENPEFLIIRTQSESFEYTINNLRQKWQEINPELPFDFELLEESFSSLYSSEKKLGLVFTYLTLFAMFIASLGLLGLVSYTAEQRTKEIGIRKVMGASVFALSKMLSIEYIRLILLSNFLAVPITYLLMDRWLRNFSYKANLPWWVFVASCGLTLLIALVIINIQTIKLSSQNPVKSLKYE